MADPSTQQLQPDETDLLIRSISTLLYSLWPYTPQATRADSTHSLTFLNKIALLFVSSARNDSAAIATFVYKDNVHVEVIHEHPNKPDQSALQDIRAPHEPDQSQLRVFQNVKTSVLQQVHDGVALVALREELLRNPVLFCFTRGLDAITPELHGNVLQDILTRMCAVEDERRREAVDTLTRYIFCFGIRKIRRRLNTKMDQSALPYLHLLTSSKISKEDFIAKRTNVKVKLPQKLENADEKWLKETLEEIYPDKVDVVRRDQKGRISIQLRLTKDQEWNLWELFKRYLQNMETLTLALERVTEGNQQLKPSDLEDAANLPFLLAQVLRNLHSLTNDSPTLWTIVEQRQELIYGISRQLGQDSRMEQGLPNSPPASCPPQESGGALQQPTEADADAEPSDAETDYSAWQDIHLDDDEVRPGAQTPRTRGPSNSAASSHMQHDEPERGLSTSIREIRRWLVLLTEWYQAVAYLYNRSFTTRFLNKSLTIHVELAPEPFTPNQQASLRSTVDSLSFEAFEADSDTRLDLIIARAHAKFPSHNCNAGDAISVLLNASPKDEKTLKAWETTFKGTSAHCEALLACHLTAQNAANMSIGISKRCCFCCAAVLEHLGFKDKHIGRHGKVYPWSPPPGADVGTKEAVLRSLKDRLADCLRLQYEGHRTGDSGPISASGSPRDGTDMPAFGKRVPLSQDSLNNLAARWLQKAK